MTDSFIEDSFVPENESNSFTYNTKNNENEYSLENIMKSILPHLQNLGAGILQGGKSSAESSGRGLTSALSGFKDGNQSLWQSINQPHPNADEEEKKWQQQFQQSPLGKFDPYKTMGTKNLPWNTVGGAEQLAGELAPALIGLGHQLNPMRLTNRGIARNVLRQRGLQRELYGEHYNDVFDQARQYGLGQNLPALIPHLDLRTAFLREPAKARLAANEFIANANTETAHTVKSALLKIQRKLTKQSEKQTLDRGDVRKLDAVNDALRNIEANMFTDANGIVHQPTANLYRNVQQGYNADVLPYTQNAKLGEYGRGDLLAKELIPYLKKGKFAARRGWHHPAIKLQTPAKYAAGILGGGALAGLGLKGGYDIYEALKKFLNT